MRLVYFIFASLSLFISSCKKDTAKNVSEIPETSCVCLKENIGVTFANTVSCSGFLSMTNYIELTGNTPLTFVSCDAFFNNIADIQQNGRCIIVDSVYLNQESLMSRKDANGVHMYYKNDYLSWPWKQDWSIYGANGIPTFTFSADVKNPLADFSLIPDNISKTSVKSFKINGVTNITGGSVTIFSSEQSGSNVSVIIREGSNEICFPAEQLKQVIEGRATVLIILENTMTKSFGNKNFAFSKKIQYAKAITLNP